MKSVSLLLTLVVFCGSVKLPSNFRKCDRQQPDLNECILKAAQDGITQMTKPYDSIGLPNLHPFEVKKATIPGTGAVAVDQNFQNCKLFGLTDIQLEKFEFDFEKKTLQLILLIPEIKMLCEYELDGKVLLLPIKGKGPSTIILKNINAVGSMNYEEITRKKKTYLKFTSIDLNIDPKLVTFNFENLFNGDKQLGDNINQVLNDNWKDVFDDVKDGYIEIIKQILLSILNGFFSKVSLEEAFD